MSARHLVFALLASLLLALLPLALVAFMTSGAWSPGRVRWQDLVLVLPVFVSMQLGLGRNASLMVTFVTYAAIAFAVLAWYIRRVGLETRPADERDNHRQDPSPP